MDLGPFVVIKIELNLDLGPFVFIRIEAIMDLGPSHGLGLFKFEKFHTNGLRPICSKPLMDLGLFKIKHGFFHRFRLTF